MKQRITRKEIESLSEDQKRRLSELWTPALYDVAIARVLKNVATEEYDEYEFVIGGISLSGTSIYLADITAARAALSGQQDTEDTSDAAVPAIKSDTILGESYYGFGSRDDYNNAARGMEKAFEDSDAHDGENEGEYEDEAENEADEEQQEEFSEEDLEENYQPLLMLIKSDCTPLLNIGNMIELLQSNGFGRHDFFLSASTYDIGCELGKDASSWGNNTDWEPAELCDVLWESVKALL